MLSPCKFFAKRNRVGAALIVLVLTACAERVPIKPPAPPKPPPTAVAERLLLRGDFAGAAAEYERIALGAETNTAQGYLGLAALAHIDGGDVDTASALLAQLTSSEQGDHVYVTLAQHRLANVRATKPTTASALSGIDENRLTPYARGVFHRAQAKHAFAEQRYDDALLALVKADEFALPPDLRARLHRDIWRALSHTDGIGLETMRRTGGGQLPAWVELNSSVRPLMHDGAALSAAIDTWRARYPEHPANFGFVEYLRETAESLTAMSRHVALILPFDGRYGAAANAIRDGFLSAWYADSGNRPIVSIYSASSENINERYDTAVANGADFVVGPLEKSAVSALLSRAELPVRTLSLNVSNENVSGAGAKFATLSQFGLTPEGEAVNAAERAWSDGRTRAVAMAPETAWGQRVVTAFAERWQELGGVLLNAVNYGNESTSYPKSVKAALSIDASEARASELRRVIGRALHFEPRRRADLEAIFVAGFPLELRQLLPQFRYFRAESLPVYATSHVFTGANNASADQDLDGVRFGDMPWLFHSANADGDATNFRRNWPNHAAGAGRLYAFGLDAYRLLPYLARMRHQPDLRVPGATGALSMDADARITRDLAWAQFHRGVPRALDP